MYSTMTRKKRLNLDVREREGERGRQKRGKRKIIGEKEFRN